MTTAASEPSVVTRAERGARAAWSRIAEPADDRALEIVAEHGAVDALGLVRSGDPAVPEVFRMRIERFGVDAEPDALLAAAQALDATVLCPGDPEWPQRVDDHPTPPLCLWVLGNPDLASLGERSVSVVGARSSTAYGNTVASGLGAGLAERGWTVVSGAAFGIDAAAHRGALSVDGATVAVLAGGLDRPYPLAHATLLARIAEVGAVVSEVAPGLAPTRPRFLLRNRIIATISRGVVVVEAALRSGSLNTARTAAEIGRPVGVVPGPVTSMMSAGCHQARRDGLAEIVTDVDEVIDLVGDFGIDAAPRRSADPVLTDLLDPHDAQVFASVPVRRAMTTIDIAVAAAIPVSVTGAALGRLQLQGFVRRDGDGWRKAVMRPD
ncbi:MAG TPA: DNA-processing protein DprA [Lapillicoccus sp.]|nr:DNA-processing protein DprA [Lapillicoccus sp.]